MHPGTRSQEKAHALQPQVQRATQVREVEVLRPNSEDSSCFNHYSPLVALTRAFYWQQVLRHGVGGSGSEIAERESLHHSAVTELRRLTLREPAIIQSILAGQQPRCMSLLWFQRNPLPTDWMAEREVVVGFDSC